MKQLKGKSGIYMIQNRVTGDSYVGSSVNLYGRMQQHFSGLRRAKHYNLLMQRSFTKYGESNFTYVVLEFCSREDLGNREQHFVNSLNPKFNIIREVERHALPEESRLKVSATLKEGYGSGRIVSQSFKPVLQYNLDSKFLKEFPSLNSACEEVGIVASTIIRCLKGPYSTAGGFIWRYKGDNTPVAPGRRKKERAVIFTSKDGTEVLEFRSYKLAAAHFMVQPNTIQQYYLRKIYFQKKYLVTHAPS